MYGLVLVRYCVDGVVVALVDFFGRMVRTADETPMHVILINLTIKKHDRSMWDLLKLGTL